MALLEGFSDSFDQGDSDVVDEAIEAMQTCHRRDPHGAYARDAAYQVGRLYHEAGNFRAAAKAHQKFVLAPTNIRNLFKREK
mgnify:CR=1 FL=1